MSEEKVEEVVTRQGVDETDLREGMESLCLGSEASHTSFMKLLIKLAEIQQAVDANVSEAWLGAIWGCKGDEKEFRKHSKGSRCHSATVSEVQDAFQRLRQTLLRTFLRVREGDFHDSRAAENGEWW